MVSVRRLIPLAPVAQSVVTGHGLGIEHRANIIGGSPRHGQLSAFAHRVSAPACPAGFPAARWSLSDYQQPETDDLGQSMDGLPRRPRITQASGQPRRHAKAGLDLAQRQHPGIRGKLATIKPGHHRLAGYG